MSHIKQRQGHKVIRSMSHGHVTK